jgi:HEAT repeat protein
MMRSHRLLRMGLVVACLVGPITAGAKGAARPAPAGQAVEAAGSNADAVQARVEALLRQASSYLEEDEAKREAAKAALVDIGAPAVPSLVSRLGTSDVMEQIAIFDVLPRMGEPAAAALHELLQARAPGGERAASTLERRRAMSLIGTIGSLSSRPVLLEACDDPDWVVRSAAAAGLGKLGAQDAEARRRLLALLDDGDWNVRLRAVLALGDAGVSGEEIDLVAGCLLDEHFAVRQAACEILGDLGEAAVTAVARRLNTGAPTVVQRATCLEALGRTSSTTAVGPVEPYLTDPSPVVRYYAAEAFAATASAAEGARCRSLLETEHHPAVRRALERAVDALNASGEG